MDAQHRADAIEYLRWHQIGQPRRQRCTSCGKWFDASYEGGAKWWPEYRRHVERGECHDPSEDEGTAAMRAKLKELGGGRARRSTGEPPKMELEPVERVQSRPKGAKYELVIAKVFMKWFGGIWRRTPLSGGWAKGEGFDVPGDLVCTIPQPFHVECKNREGWDLTDLITGINPRGSISIVEWWKQSMRECPKGKVPLLIFRRNHLADNLLMMKEEDFIKLGDIAGFTEFMPHFKLWLEVDGYTGPLVICTLTDFTSCVRPPKQSPNHKSWQPTPLSRT